MRFFWLLSLLAAVGVVFLGVLGVLGVLDWMGEDWSGVVGLVVGVIALLGALARGDR